MATNLAFVCPKHKRNRARAQTAPRREPATITGPVYLASPLGTFRTPSYDAKLAATRAHFPRADVLPARDLFHSNDDWRHRWPSILPTLRALVFFDDGAGYLGLGTYTEAVDAFQAGVPVWYLDDAGELHRLTAATFAEMPGFDPDADGDSDIVLIPHLADPLNGRMDPARCVIVGRVERFTGVETLATFLKTRSGGAKGVRDG